MLKPRKIFSTDPHPQSGNRVRCIPRNVTVMISVLALTLIYACSNAYQGQSEGLKQASFVSHGNDSASRSPVVAKLVITETVHQTLGIEIFFSPQSGVQPDFLLDTELELRKHATDCFRSLRHASSPDSLAMTPADSTPTFRESLGRMENGNYSLRVRVAVLSQTENIFPHLGHEWWVAFSISKDGVRFNLDSDGNPLPVPTLPPCE